MIDAAVDYVTGGGNIAVAFNPTRLDGRIIASMQLQETHSFTETKNRADDGAAVYSMFPVSETSITAQLSHDSSPWFLRAPVAMAGGKQGFPQHGARSCSQAPDQ